MPLLSREDVQLSYEIAGSGPPVIFIQGVGVAGDGWRPQIDVLSSNFQTLRFDHRGIGRSLPCPRDISIQAMAGDTRALMDAAGWGSAHVVGHSMGLRGSVNSRAFRHWSSARNMIRLRCPVTDASSRSEFAARDMRKSPERHMQ